MIGMRFRRWHPCPAGVPCPTLRATPVALGETRRESCIPAPEGHRPLHYCPRIVAPVWLWPPAPVYLWPPAHAVLRPDSLAPKLPPCVGIPASALSWPCSSSWATRYGRSGRISTTPRVVVSHLASHSPRRRPSQLHGPIPRVIGHSGTSAARVASHRRYSRANRRSPPRGGPMAENSRSNPRTRPQCAPATAGRPRGGRVQNSRGAGIQKSRGASTPASRTEATSRVRFSFWGNSLSP